MASNHNFSWLYDFRLQSRDRSSTGTSFRPGQKVIYSKKSPIRQAEPESKGSLRLVGKRIALGRQNR